MVNYDLARSMGLSPDNIGRLEDLHAYRELLDNQRLSGILDRATYMKLWTDNENQIQQAWGWPADPNKHIFWNSPHCTCPQMDNMDAWGTGVRYYSDACPLHGGVDEV